jgi:hypothetical protein
LDVQKALHGQLRSGAHFGSWFAMNMGRLTGLKRFRARSLWFQSVPVTWTGVFSNLGRWSEDQAGIGQANNPWVGCPPVTRKFPISCGAIILKGRMGLAIQIHPSIAPDETTTLSLIKQVSTRLTHAESQDQLEETTIGFSRWESIAKGQLIT